MPGSKDIEEEYDGSVWETDRGGEPGGDLVDIDDNDDDEFEVFRSTE